MGINPDQVVFFIPIQNDRAVHGHALNLSLVIHQSYLRMSRRKAFGDCDGSVDAAAVCDNQMQIEPFGVRDDLRGHRFEMQRLVQARDHGKNGCSAIRGIRDGVHERVHPSRQ